MSSLKNLKITLRGHHLICLHFFKGEGYSTEFIGNLKKILQSAETGEEITIRSGPDDICNMCPYLNRGTCSYEVDADSEIKGMDMQALELLGLEVGIRVKWMDIRNRLPHIFGIWAKKYCVTCNWRSVCERTHLYQKILYK